MKSLFSFLITSTLAAHFALAAIPKSPLTTEYTVVGSETVANTPYVINSTGTLNIGSDTLGEGSFAIEYSEHKLMFSGAGTINIGTDNTAGAFYFRGTNSAFPTENYATIFDFAGTINIAQKGKFVLDNYMPSTYGNIVRIKNLNLYGSLETNLNSKSNVYFGIVNLNAYAGSKINFAQELCAYGNGVWNIYGGSNITGKLRARETSTINLIGAGAFSTLGELSLDGAGTKLNLKLSDNSYTLKKLTFANTSTLTISLSETKQNCALLITTLLGKDNSFDPKTRYGNSFVFENFANDTIFFGDTYGIQIFENKLRITSGSNNMDFDLTAYAGSKDGEKLDGDWSLVFDDKLGYYALNNSAIPEPSTVAAILGALAIAFAIARRRK